MNEQLAYIAELLEQIRLLLSNQRVGSGQQTGTNLPQSVEVANQPIRVQLTNTTVQADLQVPVEVEIQNTPIPVLQSGSWTVGISGQPLSVRSDHSDLKYAVVSANSSGDTTIVNGVSGKRIVVVAFAIVASGEVFVKFRSSGTDITGGMKLVEAGGVAHAYDGGLFRTAVGEALRINLSANVQVGGYLVYREV